MLLPSIPAAWSTHDPAVPVAAYQPFAAPENRFASVVERFAYADHRRGARIARRREAEIATHIEHRLVLGQHVAGHLADSRCPRNLDQPAQQHIADAVPFPVTAHRDR